MMDAENIRMMIIDMHDGTCEYCGTDNLTDLLEFQGIIQELIERRYEIDQRKQSKANAAEDQMILEKMLCSSDLGNE